MWAYIQVYRNITKIYKKSNNKYIGVLKMSVSHRK